jgi:hypothetical protein
MLRYASAAKSANVDSDACAETARVRVTGLHSITSERTDVYPYSPRHEYWKSERQRRTHRGERQRDIAPSSGLGGRDDEEAAEGVVREKAQDLEQEYRPASMARDVPAGRDVGSVGGMRALEHTRAKAPAGCADESSLQRKDKKRCDGDIGRKHARLQGGYAAWSQNRARCDSSTGCAH